VKSAPHILQCYQADEAALVGKAVEFLRDGLDRGRALVIIATPAHRTLFLRGLKNAGSMWRPDAPTIVLRDAAATLERIVVDGMPDAARFEEAVGTVVRAAVAGDGVTGAHAYGDMVGLLWRARRFDAAHRLERYWNELQDKLGFALFCGYPIDIFSEQFRASAIAGIMREHTHMVESTRGNALKNALAQALFEHVAAVPDAGVRALRNELLSWANMPDPEATMLWLREALPDRAEEIIAQTKRYYERAAETSALEEPA